MLKMLCIHRFYRVQASALFVQGSRLLKVNDIGAGQRSYNKLTGLNKPRVVDDRGRTWDFRAQGTGPEAFNRALDQKTGMSRAIARQILQQDTRLKTEARRTLHVERRKRRAFRLDEEILREIDDESGCMAG